LVTAGRTLPTFLYHIPSSFLHNLTNGRRIRGGAANAEFLQLFYQSCLSVASRRAGKALGGGHFLQGEDLSGLERGKHTFGLFLLFIVSGFQIHFKEAVKFQHFPFGEQHGVGEVGNADADHRFLQFGIGHL